MTTALKLSSASKLSSAGRIALRKALTNSTGWTSAFRNKHGFSLSTMGVADYHKAASLLGLDVAAIVRSVDDAKLDAARRTFDSVDADKKYARTEKSFENRDAMEAEYKARRAADEFDAEISAVAEEIAPAKPAQDAARSIFKETATVTETGAAARLASIIAELTASPALDEVAVREIVKREIDLALADNVSVVRIELTDNGIAMPKVDGHKHSEFAKLLRCATARDASGYCPNIWLAGPAGSGKTFAVGQVARALGVDFHYNGAIGMSHELLGFVDAAGKYHRTAFREAYEHGGCYLFDEVDGSDNAALLALNAALANGTATFPDGVVKRHTECRIFAAANTWGLGATSDYVGRTKLDAAFLSRFPVRIMWSYDEELEQAMCGNKEFAVMVQRARRSAIKCGLKVLITPRDSMAGAAMVAAGFSLLDAADLTYFANLSTDQRDMIERNLAGV